jgi:hypothetical protein
LSFAFVPPTNCQLGVPWALGGGWWGAPEEGEERRDNNITVWWSYIPIGMVRTYLWYQPYVHHTGYHPHNQQIKSPITHHPSPSLTQNPNLPFDTLVLSLRLNNMPFVHVTWLPKVFFLAMTFSFEMKMLSRSLKLGLISSLKCKSQNLIF